MKPAEFLEILKTRRSVRAFLPDPVAESDIEQMLSAAASAPSGTNQQNWRFIVVTSSSVKQALRSAVDEALETAAKKIGLPDARTVFRGYTANFTFFDSAPVVIAAVKKPYVSVTEKIFKRYKIEQAAPSTAGVQGASAAVENLLLMAHALGYGSCWMTGPLIARGKLEELLGIAAPDELLALIPVGRTAGPVKDPGKKPVSEISRYL
jgi:nitroreductase